MLVSRSLAVPAIGLACALALTGCGDDAGDGDDAAAATTLTVSHAQGETEVPENPENVIALDLASLDTLGALGVEVQGTVTENVPDYLTEYVSDDMVNAGSMFEPDLTAIEAEQPDLIIVANRSAEALPELAEIAPTIDLSLDWENYLESFTNNVETLGEIFRKQDEAEQALADIETRVAETGDQLADAGDALVIMTSGGDVTAFGPGSRFGVIYDLFGVQPTIEDVEAATHGDPVSFEFLLDHDPSWLIVVDREQVAGDGAGESAAQILDNELMHQTQAWQDEQLVYLEPAPWYVVMSGLNTFDRMVDQVGGLAP